MGRQIVKVPANWDHPRMTDTYGRDGFQPMYDSLFSERFAEWLADFDRIRSGDMSDLERECYPLGLGEWANDEAPPDPKYYRTWDDEEAVWWQMWETVSEGTPVSPAFETAEELIEYLAENGDFWDQSRCKKPGWATLWGGTPGVSAWGHERAERFVRGSGYAPSMVIVDGNAMSGVEFVTSIDE